ncbi:arsenate reductase [Acinetobacter baumannii]|nr:arsenate reductase [Acinetobacter baumannii]EKX4418844.1 arsenate reductase [Acinetobacter baumannii]EKX4434686.1 arsenate reductase [Acinetobacter baumannii]EKX4469939.1 arsenate reductase [Acinetobacter baumannii]EKX4629523.1 arsenate reductase [Acinetobacter baumannii]
MLKIYGIKNCNSMKKAFDALQAKGLSYEFHDYKKQGIDADTLKIWLKEIGQDTVLNKKGTTWKKLSEEEQTRALSSEDHLIEALIAQPSLIKRPVLQTSKGFLVGFDETAYQNLSAKKNEPNGSFFYLGF